MGFKEIIDYVEGEEGLKYFLQKHKMGIRESFFYSERKKNECVYGIIIVVARYEDEEGIPSSAYLEMIIDCSEECAEKRGMLVKDLSFQASTDPKLLEVHIELQQKWPIT